MPRRGWARPDPSWVRTLHFPSSSGARERVRGTHFVSGKLGHPDRARIARPGDDGWWLAGKCRGAAGRDQIHHGCEHSISRHPPARGSASGGPILFLENWVTRIALESRDRVMTGGG